MKIKITGLVLGLLIMVNTLKADSPLTSTYFAASYYDYSIVSQAEVNRGLNDEIAAYLLNEDNPIDVKAAIINGIGWNYDGTNNSELFKEYLAKSKGITTAQLNLDDLSAHQLFCLGYLMGLDNYFVVDEAINVLEKAAAKNKTSFTIHLVLNITKAQKAMDTDFCKVWKLTAETLNNKTLKRDMKTAAIQSVVDYMLLYKGDCI
ncbi:MAG TPA: hypothetical protein PLB46_07895 [Chitinophagales bacterium]|nr:hypothetical protein [Chitinophagales bacterium]